MANLGIDNELLLDFDLFFTLSCNFEDSVELIRVGIDPTGLFQVLKLIVKILPQVDLN
jgi:hypothetical protein